LVNRKSKQLPLLCSLLFALFTFISLGCGQPASSPTAPQPAAPLPKPSSGPVEIELLEPKVKFRDADSLTVEVHYKYAKGECHPDRFYNLEIRSQGTNTVGTKPMYGVALRSEGGTIKDWFSLRKAGEKSFEIFLTEASAQQGPFHNVSNVLKGDIEK